MTPSFQTLTDEQLAMVAGIEDFDKISHEVSGKRALIVGGGDLACKKEPWVTLLKRLGVEVYLADINKRPKALDRFGPLIQDFFVIGSGDEEKRLTELGRKEAFDLVDISTWGNSHLAMAMRFQDSAKLIIDTKPVDTNLDLLRTIQEYNAMEIPLFHQLISRFLMHDHYGGRWVLPQAAKEITRCLSTQGFVIEVQIYIVEKRSVNDERERIHALKDGICLDLMPHAIWVLQRLMPTGSAWRCADVDYRRRDLRLTVTGGAREQNRGCVIPGQVETFAATGLHGEDIVDIEGEWQTQESYPFRCLIVVSKGTAASEDDRDTKGVSIKFQSGRRLDIDLDSQRMRTPEGQVVLPPKDVLHRGINWPLIQLVKAGITHPLPADLAQYFQPFEAAYRAAELIDNARKLPWLGHAYRVGEECTNLVNSIPRDWWRGDPWQLQSLPPIHFGDVPKETLSIP